MLSWRPCHDCVETLSQFQVPPCKFLQCYWSLQACTILPNALCLAALAAPGSILACLCNPTQQRLTHYLKGLLKPSCSLIPALHFFMIPLVQTRLIGTRV